MLCSSFRNQHNQSDEHHGYPRSEYNAKGQLTKQYQDTGSNTATTAPTLYEYDNFGNLTKQTLALSDTPTPLNSPITEMAYSVESTDEGVFSVTTNTRYNAEGNPLMSVQKLLISNLSDTIESKNLTIDERNLTSTQWVEYHVGTKRKSYNTLPTSDITAEAVTVDGFTLSQKDNAGVTITASRSYTANGMIHTRTDGRSNTTTTVTDKAGRTLTVTDAAGNVSTTAYDSAHDLPATVTDAQGNTSCYRYDARGRKLVEWGTGIQPVMFGYDDADRMTSLTTFRASEETVSTNPSDRTDGDVTTWSYHDASGMEISKTYADSSSVVKTYDAYNRVLTETDARGKVKAHTYEQARGLLLGISYNDSTTPRAYTYNHLGQLTQVTDAAGVRTLSYNAYGEQESDSLVADNVTHLITETRDDKGRSTGYTYAKNGTVQQTVTTGYGSDGRIASAGFLHGGTAKQFSYQYLSGTHLLEKLTMPNNMSLTQSYEIQRDLLIGMAYHRGTTLVANRQYSYDTLGRPTVRNTSRQGTVKNDTFGYNNRSELTTATVNGSNYAYDYDNIGNRETATESEITTTYTANELNQYTAIGDFTPTFDADGNQTLVKSSTGTWEVNYDAENRPVSFTNTESSTVVECAYDSMGRRATKKVTIDGEVTLHQCYLYRGYLQIACCDLTRSAHPCLWLITWDPTQPIATRPLAIQKDGTWYTYGWDLTKNICELYGTNGYIRTSYTYSPYGSVTESGNTWQPIQWSSEYSDIELGLVYYNYRHYNPIDGRWLGIDIFLKNNLYIFLSNPLISYDYLGAFDPMKGGFLCGEGMHGKRYPDNKVEVFCHKLPNGDPMDYVRAVYDRICGYVHFREFCNDKSKLADILSSSHCYCKDKCVEKLLIAVHGNVQEGMYEGVDSLISIGEETLFESSVLHEISNLFINDKFCKQCIIEIRSCRLGSGTFLMQRMKSKYPCTVMLYTNPVKAVAPNHEKSGLLVK